MNIKTTSQTYREQFAKLSSSLEPQTGILRPNVGHHSGKSFKLQNINKNSQLPDFHEAKANRANQNKPWNNKPSSRQQIDGPRWWGTTAPACPRASSSASSPRDDSSWYRPCCLPSDAAPTRRRPRLCTGCGGPPSSHSASTTWLPNPDRNPKNQQTKWTLKITTHKKNSKKKLQKNSKFEEKLQQTNVRRVEKAGKGKIFGDGPAIGKGNGKGEKPMKPDFEFDRGEKRY